MLSSINTRKPRRAPRNRRHVLAFEKRPIYYDRVPETTKDLMVGRFEVDSVKKGAEGYLIAWANLWYAELICRQTQSLLCFN